MRANVGVRAQPFHHRVARLAAPFIATAPVARPALSDPTLRGPTEKGERLDCWHSEKVLDSREVASKKSLSMTDSAAIESTARHCGLLDC